MADRMSGVIGVQTPGGVRLPPLTTNTLSTSLIAGIAADVVWEVWARAITPYLPGVGGPLEPAALVQSVFGFENPLLGEAIHLVVGFLFYPLGYLFVARPVQRAFAPSLSPILTGMAYGVGLWVFALYVMAHLVAGLPAFLEFSPLAWASLGGHLLFGAVTAAVVSWRDVRAAPALTPA